jgi:hypothetical protein
MPSKYFTEIQIDALRDEYRKLVTIDPDTAAHEKICSCINAMSHEQLLQIRGARIPFLSARARNRAIQQDAGFHFQSNGVA